MLPSCVLTGNQSGVWSKAAECTELRLSCKNRIEGGKRKRESRNSTPVTMQHMKVKKNGSPATYSFVEHPNKTSPLDVRNPDRASSLDLRHHDRTSSSDEGQYYQEYGNMTMC
nr:uncharacterized protein LOC117692939 [Crassostrea gigas]